MTDLPTNQQTHQPSNPRTGWQKDMRDHREVKLPIFILDYSFASQSFRLFKCITVLLSSTLEHYYNVYKKIFSIKLYILSYKNFLGTDALSAMKSKYNKENVSKHYAEWPGHTDYATGMKGQK